MGTQGEAVAVDMRCHGGTGPKDLWWQLGSTHLGRRRERSAPHEKFLRSIKVMRTDCYRRFGTTPMP